MPSGYKSTGAIPQSTDRFHPHSKGGSYVRHVQQRARISGTIFQLCSPHVGKWQLPGIRLPDLDDSATTGKTKHAREGKRHSSSVPHSLFPIQSAIKNWVLLCFSIDLRTPVERIIGAVGQSITEIMVILIKYPILSMTHKCL